MRIFQGALFYIALLLIFDLSQLFFISGYNASFNNEINNEKSDKISTNNSSNVFGKKENKTVLNENFNAQKADQLFIGKRLLRDINTLINGDSLYVDNFNNPNIEKTNKFSAFLSRPVRNIINKSQRAPAETLESLYAQLAILQPCNRTLESPLIRQLLNEVVRNLEKNLTTYTWLFELGPKITYLPHAKGLFYNININNFNI